MTVASAFDQAPALEDVPVLPRTIDDRTITDIVCAQLLRPAGKGWWIAFIVCSAATLTLIYGVHVLFTVGIGIFGNNVTVVWGFPVANYVFWIGLGNAGTLISSLLVLTRQSWRATISRFAEAMTLFAVSIAGLFPIFHLGRPLVIGVGLVSRLAWLMRASRLSLASPQLEVTMLYWHLVDAFWLVLFPVLYIAGRG
jgi:Ni/Fe-hydrogenase subunit HybB-like protein